MVSMSILSVAMLPKRRLPSPPLLLECADCSTTCDGVHVDAVVIAMVALVLVPTHTITIAVEVVVKAVVVMDAVDVFSFFPKHAQER